ncbi:hypothetical protein FRC09_017907, partial [Ceratobasidium sp. 395]
SSAGKLHSANKNLLPKSFSHHSNNHPTMRSANFFTISFVVLLSVLRLTYSKPAIAAGDIVERDFTSLEIPSTPGTINHKALNGGLTSNKSKSEKS